MLLIVLLLCDVPLAQALSMAVPYYLLLALILWEGEA